MWTRAKDLALAALLDPSNENGVLSLALAKCDVFQNIPEAQETVEHWGEVLGDSAEKAGEYIDDRIPEENTPADPETWDPSTWVQFSEFTVADQLSLFPGTTPAGPELVGIFNRERKRMRRVIAKLRAFKITVSEPYYATPPNNRFFAECKFHVIVDEVVGAFSAFNPASAKFERLHIAFALIGNSQVRFRDSGASSGFVEWAYLEFSLKKGQPVRVELKMPSMPDASRLSMQHHLYRALKSLVIETWHQIVFGNLSTGSDIDPNDPGTLSPADIPRPRWFFGATVANTDFGCRLVTVTVGGAADRAGLKKDDYVTHIDSAQVGKVGGQVVTISSRTSLSSTGLIDIKYMRKIQGQYVERNVVIQCEPAP